MKTSQKMALRSTSARAPMAARPLAMRPLRALPNDEQMGPATPPVGPGVQAPNKGILLKSLNNKDVDPVTALSTEAKTPTLGQVASGVPASNVGRVEFPSFVEVMGFNGAAPELINGRLAMLGFVAAVGAELATGETVFSQVKDAPAAIFITFLLFIAASLFPAFKRKNGLESNGVWTPQAEMWNGRAAMIGFSALLAIEAVRHVALF